MESRVTLTVLFDQFNRESEVKCYLHDEDVEIYHNGERIQIIAEELIFAVSADFYDNIIKLTLNGGAVVTITPKGVDWVD